jgi:hypothetical protein
MPPVGFIHEAHPILKKPIFDRVTSTLIPSWWMHLPSMHVGSRSDEPSMLETLAVKAKVNGPGRLEVMSLSTRSGNQPHQWRPKVDNLWRPT